MSRREREKMCVKLGTTAPLGPLLKRFPAHIRIRTALRSLVINKPADIFLNAV